ncbi:hypothetical protein C8F04DRAFT_1196713 [Mycena alexandri]|uniref:Uncharacterized protein n=1 Tax=Mycena alexandri TaxID=1745969 RepID=A0AAD6S3W0_9AGAR|nr:hypothetical protein C8F04DRAFT_1196713 [Mycena alexandri]
MFVYSREATGFLIIKTEQAGKWRVNFWHRQVIMNAGDLSVSFTLHTQVAGDTTLLGTMKISPIEEFKRDSLTAELPAGVHQIDLRFFKKDNYGFAYLLRKVWVTCIHPDTNKDLSAAGDEPVSNEVHTEVEEAHAEVEEPVQSGGIRTARHSTLRPVIRSDETTQRASLFVPVGPFGWRQIRLRLRMRGFSTPGIDATFPSPLYPRRALAFRASRGPG